MHVFYFVYVFVIQLKNYKKLLRKELKLLNRCIMIVVHKKKD